MKINKPDINSITDFAISFEEELSNKDKNINLRTTDATGGHGGGGGSSKKEPSDKPPKKNSKKSIADYLDNLSFFQEELLKVSRQCNVNKTREFIDDKYWDGIKIDVSKYHLLDAIMRLDVDNLKLLKNYTNLLNKSDVLILKDEASSPQELKDFYNVIIKSGITNISKSEFTTDNLVNEGVSVETKKDIAIPFEWKKLLGEFQDNGFENSFIAGDELSDLYLSNIKGNSVTLFVDTHPLDYDSVRGFPKILKQAGFKTSINKMVENGYLELKDNDNSVIAIMPTSYSFLTKLNKKPYKVNIILSSYPVATTIGFLEKDSQKIRFDGHRIIKSDEYNNFLNKHLKAVEEDKNNNKDAHSLLSVDEIPDNWKDSLKTFQDNIDKNAIIGGLCLANLNLNHPNSGGIDIYMNSNKEKDAKKSKFFFGKKQCFSDKLLEAFSNNGTKVDFVELVKNSNSFDFSKGTYTPSYVIKLNKGLKINLYVVDSNKDDIANFVLSGLNYYQSIIYDGYNIKTNDGYLNNLKNISDRNKFKNRVKNLRQTISLKEEYFQKDKNRKRDYLSKKDAYFEVLDRKTSKINSKNLELEDLKSLKKAMHKEKIYRHIKYGRKY